MFKKKNKLIDVIDYVLHENKLIILRNNSAQNNKSLVTIDISNGAELSSTEVESSANKLLSGDSAILCKYADGTAVLANANAQIIMELPEDIKIGRNDVVTERMVIYRKSFAEKRHGVYSIARSKELWTLSDINHLEKIDNYFFSQAFNQTSFKLFLHDVNSGKKVWQLDLNEKFPKIVNKPMKLKLIGTFQNGLLVGAEHLDKLIAIDIETGTIIWERTTLPNYYVIDRDKNIAHILTATYKSVYLNNGKERSADLNRQETEDRGMYSQRQNYIVNDNYIFTTDYKKKKLGAYNTRTNKYDWIYEDEEALFHPAAKIVYSSPYLFINDLNNSLYIFKKNNFSFLRALI